MVMNKPEGWMTESAGQTEAVGRELAIRLRAGDVVLVSGEIGAGKTTLVRAICMALGVTETVTSPTYTIGRLYEGRDGDQGLLIAHLDLYRLGGLESEEPALIEDYIGPDRLTLVEWPERAEGALTGRATFSVEIEHRGEDRRRILCRG